jgi:tetraacyldisaccharide 4'-kinase
MKFVRLILFSPISLIYWLITHLRNLAYDYGVLKTNKFPVKVICVGNLRMRGTGKTPVVEYITELLLQNNLSVAILSRGYKRKTKGYILAGEQSNSSEIGDEPYQIKRKFGKAQVAVCEKRATGIQNLIDSCNKPDVIILDDAFQHRSVSAGLNILLTEYSKPYYTDFILPSGNLREATSGSKRADIILVTKSPVDISENNIEKIRERINPSISQSLFFTNIEYQKLKPVFNDTEFEEADSADYSSLLFSGISNPDPLINFLKLKFKEIISMKFADHYSYTLKDQQKITRQFNNITNTKKIIITTEKDFARIEKTNIEEYFKKLPLYYIPLKVKFYNHNLSNNFDTKILDYVRKDTRNL